MNIDYDTQWLAEQGFSPDKMGTMSKDALHIELGNPDGVHTPPPYACIRSFPIPVPQSRHDVTELLRLLGIN